MGSQSPPARMSVPPDQALSRTALTPVQDDVPPGGHVVTDGRGMIQSADHAAATMVHVPQQALAGQALPDVLAPEARAVFQNHIRRLETGEHGLEWEMTLTPGGLRSFSALLTVAALRGPSGRMMALHWVIRDLSAWKRWAAGDQMLQAVSEQLRDGCSLRHILCRLCEDVVRLLPHPLVQVAAREAGDIVLCAQAGASKMTADRACRAWTSDERRMLESVLETRVTLHRREAFDPADGTIPEDGRLPSRLLVPLCARDGAVGVLVVHGGHRETFDARTRQWFEKLARQMTPYLDLRRDMTVRGEMEARIFHLAHHDALTDLPNRTMCSDRLKQALAQARRHGRGAAVLFVDLDRFKAINDSLGHETGDALIKIVADRLARCVRATDTVARLSGDEFVVVLQDVHRRQDAGHVARNVLDAIAQPVILDERRLHTTASVGIAVYPFDAANPDALMAQADRAMYRAKANGGHGYRFCSDDVTPQGLKRPVSTRSLQRAWEHGEFVLHYQPELDGRSGQVLGVETLLRWRHPERGVQDAFQFLSVAEGAGFFDAVQEWVLETACRQGLAWAARGMSFVPMSVNVSLRRASPGRILTMARRALRETAIDPRGLRLEISQSAARLQQREVGALVKPLLDEGVESVLDDVVYDDALRVFLRRLPFRRLKLASSLVCAAPDNPDSMRTLERCLAIGRTLRMSVIAKGVESAGQMAFLRERGCDELQGHGCARPLSGEDMMSWLQTRRSSAVSHGA